MPSRTVAVVWSIVAMLVLAIGLAAAALVWRGRHEALADSESRVSRFVSGAETAVNRALLGIDVLLAGMDELMASAAHADGSLDESAASRLLRGVEHRNLMVRNIVVLAGSGRVLAAAQPDIQRVGLPVPQEFEQGVRAQKVPQMAISPPVLNFSTSERSLYFARPILLPDRSRGVVVAEVPVSLLSALLAYASEIRGLVVTLERDDGQLLAAVPANELRMGQQLGAPLSAEALAGHPLRAPGRLDAVPSILVARPALYRSVNIVATLPLATALEDWQRDGWLVAGAAATFALLVIGIGSLTHWRLAGIERAKVEIAHSKALLDEALASMADGFLLCDAHDRVVLWNRRYLELFPWLEGVIGPGVPFRVLAEAGARALLPQGTEAEREAWIEMRHAIREKGRGMYELEWGPHLVIDAIERRTPDGGIVSVIRDITAAERELKRAKAAAEAANEAKSRFLAAVSHEMRTPLNAVLGMNRMLLKTPLDDEQRRFATMIRSSGQALLDLINDILDLSKIEAGRMEIETVHFSPAATVDGVVSLLSQRAQSKGLRLEMKLAPGLPLALQGDPRRLRQVLFNLIGNAVKFTEKGSVSVTASHRALPDGRVELQLGVHDTGIGIPPETLPRLFERFVQADSTTSRRYGGTGLGLAITAEIVTLMGGRIHVRSEAGQGSHFEVTIPMAPGDASQLASLGASRDTTPDALLGAGLRILVAEDNEVNQLLIQALLREMGHHCDVVDNGAAALRQLQAAPYDVVLMDIQMPEMDGEAATRAIRALPGPLAHIPVIALTANAMVEDREAYLRAGMNDYVLKPVIPRQLAAAIARVMAETEAR
jgi:signal transduction histidine kinase/ActR/RegA family two-component response regulator